MVYWNATMTTLFVFVVAFLLQQIKSNSWDKTQIARKGKTIN